MSESTDDKKDIQCEKGFNVSVSSDGLKAFLYIDSRDLDGVEITSEIINLNLAKHGVVYGIDQARIDQIVEERLLNKKLIIAEEQLHRWVSRQS